MRCAVVVIASVTLVAESHAQVPPEAREPKIDAPSTRDAAPPQPPPAPQPTPAAPTQEQKKAQAEVIAAKESQKTTDSARPQLLAVRGGSLGFAALSSNEGLLAGVDAKLDAGGGSSTLTSSSSVDAFAKVGGIDIGRILGEVIAEGFDADIPQIALTGQAALPAMVNTKFTSVGLRVRINFYNTIYTPVPEGKDQNKNQLSPDCLLTLSQRAQYPRKRALKCSPKDSEILKNHKHVVWSLMGGIRLAQRSDSSAELSNLGGVVWELGLRRDSDANIDDRLSWSAFGGISGMHVNQADVTDDNVTTRFIRENEFRASLGAEIRQTSNPGLGKALGAYGVASRAFWTNDFHVGGREKVRVNQLEGGLYISGVMKGFSGVIMFSVIRPYQTRFDNQYVISVIPFGGGTPSAEQ